MFAFAESAKYSDWLEMDVRLTADGVLIVQHDADTAKTTPETLDVAATDLATLQQLDNAYWWSPECWGCRDLPDDAYVYRGIRTGDVPPPARYSPDDFRIVTLEEVSDRFPDYPFDIEIKGSGEEGRAVAEALASELERLGRTGSSVVVSFAAPVIDAFHAAAPDVATSPGVDELARWLLDDAPLADHHDVIQVPPFYQGVKVLTYSNLERMKASGLPIWVWPNDAATQENEAFYREMIGLDVDGIIAGRPALARAATGPR